MTTETVDMTPTPVVFKQMLEFIVENSIKAEHREWAREELVRIQPDGVLVTEWSKE